MMAMDGIRVIEDAFFENNVQTPYPISCSFTSIANLELNKSEIQRLHKALDKAVDFIRTKPESAAAVVRARFGFEDTLAVGIPDFRKYDELNEALLANFSKELVAAEVLISEVPVTDVMLKPSEIR
jgi:ABC-type nitrate/sulfonate/bicarbonate transport system substrate-binding protein